MSVGTGNVLLQTLASLLQEKQLHIFSKAQNEERQSDDSRNALMLDNLAPESAQYTIKAIDSIAGQTSHICLSRLSNIKAFRESTSAFSLYTCKAWVG